MASVDAAPSVTSRPAAPTVLRCRGLTKRYGERVAVDDVSFEIGEGERYGLLGPNGAGKTTTIAMVCGVLRPDAGQVEVDGSLEPGRRRSIGYVPQELAIFPDLTANENLAFFGRLAGLRGRELRGRIAEVLEVVDLADRARDFVIRYSGGMQRRLNIAIGLLSSPRLLVLDEPTAGVDPQTRNSILEAVERMAGAGMATLYTTHYIDEAARLCTRLGIIDGGRLVAEGTPDELVSQGESDRLLRVAVAGDDSSFASACRTVSGVVGVATVDGRLEVTVDDPAATTAHLFELAGRLGTPITDLQLHRPDLETVFLRLTGHELRD